MYFTFGYSKLINTLTVWATERQMNPPRSKGCALVWIMSLWWFITILACRMARAREFNWIRNFRNRENLLLPFCYKTIVLWDQCGRWNLVIIDTSDQLKKHRLAWHWLYILDPEPTPVISDYYLEVDPAQQPVLRRWKKSQFVSVRY